MSWVEKKVLPFLDNSSSEQQLSLSRKTVEVSGFFFLFVFSFGNCFGKFISLISHFIL